MENTKGIFRLDFGCGRHGSLPGIFVEEKERVKVLIDNRVNVYFGEVMGKHSEVMGPMDDGELVLVSDDPAAVKIFEDLKLQSGHNPFDYSTIDRIEGIEGDDWTTGDLVNEIIKGGKIIQRTEG